MFRRGCTQKRPHLTPTLGFLLAIAQGSAGCSGGNPSSSSHGGASGIGAGAGNGSAGASGGSGADAPGGTGGGSAVACAPPANKDQPLALLSQTGCMDAANPTALASVVVPYEVNSPLWSDGANKSRGMRLPPGRKIHVKNCTTTPTECPQGAADDGKWVLPVGTVMVKSFLFESKLVETRLFVHSDAATWVGYSYAWNEAQTEATINPDDRVEVMFHTGTQTVDWHYPSRLDCTTCHVATAGWTLGPETAQMNRMVDGTNQIDHLATLGLFDAPVPAPYKPALVAPYPSQAGSPPGSATVEQRARSYLQANCAFCHRPDDYVFPNLDLRNGIALQDTMICGLVPAKGDQGVIGAKILDPGRAMNSTMYLRMNAPPDDDQGQHGRMPKVASYVVDQAGLDLIGGWINSLTACP